MKLAILAGGFGTRISEESDIKPKPMIEIGGKPILWHIMKYYSQFGINEFVILLGYKGYVIKEYFANYFLHNSDLTIDVKNNEISWHDNTSEDWKISLVETGLHTMTGGRILKAQKYLEDAPFCLTYGDGLSNVNIKELLGFHENHGKLMSVTAVQPAGRFGRLNIEPTNQNVASFLEKPKGDGDWINGGFFVCNPDIFKYLNEGDSTVFEQKPLENIAKDGELFAYKHSGFWQPMDTLRDKNSLNKLWDEDKAQWKIW